MQDDTNQPEVQSFGSGTSSPSSPTPVDPVVANPFNNVEPVPMPTTTPEPASVLSPQQNPKSRFRISKKMLKIMIIALSAIVLIGGGSWFFFAGPGNESALAKAFRENSPYEYKPMQNNIDVKHEFKFHYSMPYPDGQTSLHSFADLGNDSINKIIAVYSDAALSKKAQANVIDSTMAKDIVVTPTSHVDALDPVAGEKVRISNDGEWGLNDIYYIVQYVDLNTGKALNKPIVTPFTTKKEIATPVVSFNIDANGNAHFSWTAIKGATKYYVVKLPSGSSSTGDIIGQTDSTDFTYEQVDVVGSSNRYQNNAFHEGVFTNDDLLSSVGGIAIEGGAELKKDVNADYGVIAVKGDRYSSYGSLDVSAMKAQLPYAIAINTATKMGVPSGTTTVDTFDDIPTKLPIVMADNTTNLRSVIIDTNKVTSRSFAIDVPYKVQGTNLTGVYHVLGFNDATYSSEVARIAQRNIDNQDKTGQAMVNKLAEIQDLSKVTVSTSKPKVEYKINATNPLTEYLAANMLDGQKYIDVSAYIGPNFPVDPIDAFYEATEQNPYILLQVSGGWSYDHTDHIFAINYDESRDDMLKEQKTIDNEVKRVVSTVIKAGMSDREKVQALNDYIISTATYNEAALSAVQSDAPLDKFRNSWTPTGILIDKTAVCGGYAEAFKVLADGAGLESVYVGGLANGERHAWNKVKVDGKWRVIDTTWDDVPAPRTNGYFLLTDAEVEAKRSNVQMDDFIADALVANYAAN